MVRLEILCLLAGAGLTSAGIPASKSDRDAINSCPPGSHLFRNFTTGEPVTCKAQTPYTCPPPFNCVQSASNSSNFFCCLQESPKAYGCPPGQAAFLNATSQKPQVCKMNDLSGCPDGFYCQYSDPNSQFQCCRLDAGCPSDRSSEIDAATGRTKTCDFARDCGFDHSCELSQSLKRKICCKKQPALVHNLSPPKKAEKPAFGSISTPQPPVNVSKSAANDALGRPTCLDWLPTCSAIASSGQCSEDEGHSISCCVACGPILGATHESQCFDRAPNCDEFKSTTEGYCSHPSWSFDSQMNCYKTCYCQ